MTWQQRDAIVDGMLRAAASDHRFTDRKVVHVHELRNGLSFVECRECKRSVIANQRGHLFGSALSTGCN